MHPSAAQQLDLTAASLNKNNVLPAFRQRIYCNSYPIPCKFNPNPSNIQLGATSLGSCRSCSAICSILDIQSFIGVNGRQEHVATPRHTTQLKKESHSISSSSRIPGEAFHENSKRVRESVSVCNPNCIMGCMSFSIPQEKTWEYNNVKMCIIM